MTSFERNEFSRTTSKQLISAVRSSRQALVDNIEKNLKTFNNIFCPCSSSSRGLLAAAFTSLGLAAAPDVGLDSEIIVWWFVISSRNFSIAFPEWLKLFRGGVSARAGGGGGWTRARPTRRRKGRRANRRFVGLSNDSNKIKISNTNPPTFKSLEIML